jgi:hypothetical protein
MTSTHMKDFLWKKIDLNLQIFRKELKIIRFLQQVAEASQNKYKRISFF